MRICLISANPFFRSQEITCLKEATYRHTGVTVPLCTNVGSCQTVTFPIYLLAKA